MSGIVYLGLWSLAYILQSYLALGACNSPPPLQHGRSRVLESRGDLRTRAVYKCELGCFLAGPWKRRLAVDTFVRECVRGVWSMPRGLPRRIQCLSFTCRPPAPILNGVIDFQRPQSSRYNGGRVIAYSCNHGYILAGASHRKCSMKARGWTGNDPRCILIRCPTPVAPEHGYIDNTTRNKEGDTVHISCYDGYKLHGSSSMTCGPYADWSGTTPTCIKPDIGVGRCQAPAIPFGGGKIGLKSYRINDVITYRCTGDNLLVGTGRIRCTNKGWLPKRQPKCQGPFSYDNPTELAEKFARLVRKLKDGTKKDGNSFGTRGRRYLDVNSPAGLDIHFLIDASGSITEEHFRSAVTFVKTLVKMVGVSDQPNGARVGVLTFSHSAVSDRMGRFGDSSGFFANQNMPMERVLASLDALSRSGGGTNIRGALEYVRTDMIPLSLMQRERARQYVFLLSDGDSNTGGNPIPKAQQLKRTPYLNPPLEIFCIKIGVDRDANRNIQNIQKLLTISSEEELNQDGADPHFFRLKDYPAFDMLVQQLVSRQIDYSSECGIAGFRTGISSANIIAGEVSPEYAWPWMASILVSRFGHGGLGPFQFRHLCSGTLINKEWILTSASCFQREFYEQNLDQIRVKLGSNQWMLKSYADAIEVKSMHIHRGWEVDEWKMRPLMASWANDIALLRLKVPARLSMKIRTICLASNNTEHDAFYSGHVKGVVTGWGYYENRTVSINERPRGTSDDLRQVELRVLQKGSDQRCEPPSEEKVLCAGSSSLSDACSGDSGGPLMMPTARNAVGERRWYQIGIVSYGHGCGLGDKKPYGRYTDVRYYRDWIENTIKNVTESAHQSNK